MPWQHISLSVAVPPSPKLRSHLALITMSKKRPAVSPPFTRQADKRQQAAPRTQGHNFAQATQLDTKWRHEIDKEGHRVPRFLYRASLAIEDEPRILNKIDSITPVMFMNSNERRPLSVIPKEELIRIVNAHVNYNQEKPSYFSSWTHSWQRLAQSLDRLMHGHSRALGNEDVLISIVDTKKLPKSNTVLHSSFFHKLDNRILSDPSTFLIYDVVSATACMARKRSQANARWRA